VIRNIERNVTNTQIMVSDMRRTMVKGREANDSKDQLVSDIRSLPTTESPLTAT
jgi:hypothetical protein